MKSRLCSAVCVLALPLMTSAAAVAPIETVEDHVNIRFGPDAESEIVGRLAAGSSITLLDSVPGWHVVSLEGGGTGYIHQDWVEVIEEADVSAETSPEPGEAAERAAEPEAAAEVPEAVAEDDEAEAVTVAAEEAGAKAESEEAATGEPEPDAVAEADAEPPNEAAEAAAAGVTAIPGPPGPQGPPGPPGPSGNSRVEGTVDYLMKFTAPTIGGNSVVYDDGRNIGIGTTEPKQRLEVNGSIQIHEQNSSVAGLMISQSDGDTGYIMHNRANTLTIGAGSVDRVTIDRDGNVGIGMSRPTHPVEMASGAYVSAGGVWTNASSIEKKENVRDLTAEEALQALAALEPVLFNYKVDADEEYVGFIAEEVPELVATADRKSLSAMDIVAVLTRVVQTQQRQIAALEARLAADTR